MFLPRDKFVLPSKEVLRWFPGHMGKGIVKMQQKLKLVDCVIEVHDARIPISGRNPNFKRLFVGGVKPHILVLNKMDLTESKHHEYVENFISKKDGISHVIHTNCKDPKSTQIQKLIPIIQELIDSSNRFIRNFRTEFNVMIMGVPNVGKSSLINALRSMYLNKAGACQVGPTAGITKAVQNRIRISSRPEIFLYDTPGILTPQIPNVEAGMRLASCSTLRDDLVGHIVIADYILYWMNKRGITSYFNFFNVTKPDNNIGMLLANAAINRNMYFRVSNFDGSYVMKPDIESLARTFVDWFRKGKFGLFLFDSDLMKIPDENLFNLFDDQKEKKVKKKQ